MVDSKNELPIIAKGGSNFKGFCDLLRNYYRLEPQFVQIDEVVANIIRQQKLELHSEERGYKSGDRIFFRENPGYAPAVKYWLIKV